MRTPCRLRHQTISAWSLSQGRLWAATSSFAPLAPSPSTPSKRQYAQPARLVLPRVKVAFRNPPPLPPKPVESATVENGHTPGEADDAIGPFDDFLAKTALGLQTEKAASVGHLHAQYRERGGRMCNYVVPYEERPPEHRLAYARSKTQDDVGDGLVMVVHVLFKPAGKLDKVCACSGFVVDAQPINRGKQDGEVVITCAHTLEEMYRNIQRTENPKSAKSLSFIISSDGEARLVQQILSSMPRSDTIAMQLEPSDDPHATRLRSLPVTPFPVYSGMKVLTHLFGALDVPEVIRSQSRLPSSAKAYPDREEVEKPIKWLEGQAWRRWGAGNMLGYRSYTNIEVEAGIHSSLPHILTSILPTPGSSGGPLVNAETGAVVGMISGRRMDNRVEGERGWGASSESIFEMFSLPGFTPTASINSQ